MLKKRIIPVVQLMGNTVVKTVKFTQPRQVGDATATVKVFSARKADELILLDIGATRGREAPNYKFIESAAKNCFMPLTIGGGIRSFERAQRVFDSGADKIVLGSITYDDPDEIEKIVKQYGQQAVVASIDCVLQNGQYVACKAADQSPTLPISKIIRLVNNLGVGEIMITAIENEGVSRGYDVELLRTVSNLTQLPIVINGGASSISDFEAVFKLGASAAAASSIFFWEGMTIKEIKHELSLKDIAVTKF